MDKSDCLSPLPFVILSKTRFCLRFGSVLPGVLFVIFLLKSEHALMRHALMQTLLQININVNFIYTYRPINKNVIKKKLTKKQTDKQTKSTYCVSFLGLVLHDESIFFYILVIIKLYWFTFDCLVVNCVSNSRIAADVLPKVTGIALYRPIVFCYLLLTVYAGINFFIFFFLFL